MAGELIMKLAAEHKVPILPVDSEHSAIFQCLTGAYDNPIEKILLTASGGPFRRKTLEELATVTKAPGLEASELDDGGEDHDRLGLDDEQGLRDDRGEMVVRCHAGSGTGGGAPAVGDPLDGAV